MVFSLVPPMGIPCTPLVHGLKAGYVWGKSKVRLSRLGLDSAPNLPFPACVNR
ncbi:MAG: hypothetical protein QM840_11400 [Verrucomicrobiota bacterium]|nr:hypothetical protein [Verrucomicrobiota bacterium]